MVSHKSKKHRQCNYQRKKKKNRKKKKTLHRKLKIEQRLILIDKNNIISIEITN